MKKAGFVILIVLWTIPELMFALVAGRTSKVGMWLIDKFEGVEKQKAQFENIHYIRVYHDGKCKTYNSPEQFRNDISYAPCFSSTKFLNSDEVICHLEKLGFTGIKCFSLFSNGAVIFHSPLLA